MLQKEMINGFIAETWTILVLLLLCLLLILWDGLNKDVNSVLFIPIIMILILVIMLLWTDYSIRNKELKKED